VVKQGQPLYQIDAASLKATERSAAAAVAKAEASQRTLAATAPQCRAGQDRRHQPAGL
jgi:membrane fusion protein (multidrug efflux system)